jgi:hypothetical protein
MVHGWIIDRRYVLPGRGVARSRDGEELEGSMDDRGARMTERAAPWYMYVQMDGLQLRVAVTGW